MVEKGAPGGTAKALERSPGVGQDQAPRHRLGSFTASKGLFGHSLTVQSDCVLTMMPDVWVNRRTAMMLHYGDGGTVL